MGKKTATFIATGDFNAILNLLKKNGCKISAEYFSVLDKGIDFDFYVLERKGEEILMAWDNWDEGSIKADQQYLEALEIELDKKFRYQAVNYFEEGLPQIRKILFKYFWR